MDWRDDIDFDDRDALLAYRKDLLAVAAKGGPAAEAHRLLAEDVMTLAEALVADTPENSPRNGLLA